MTPADRIHVFARIHQVMRAAADRTLTDPGAAMAEMDELAEAYAGDPQILAMAESARVALALASGSPLGDVRSVRASLARLGELTAGHPGAEPLAGLLPDLLDAWQAQQDGDSPAALRIFGELAARAGELPPEHPMRQVMTESAPMLAALRAAADGETPLVPPARPGASAAEQALHLTARGGLALRQGAEQDPARIDAGLRDLREAVRLTPAGHPDRVFHLASLALGLIHRGEVTGSPADVDEAIGLLEEARRLARGPEHPHWTFVSEMLAGQYRRRGESSPARHTALEGLRGYTWRVLLQPDPASARSVARSAAVEAMAAAGRLLADHRPGDALRALDAGRGLMLFAATELRDPYTLLTEIGRRDLADRWRAAREPSPRLREQVLDALARGTGLLDPPDLAEIQGALRRLGADALVYLVPADPPTPGWAVIAPAEGGPRFLALPHLIVEAGSGVERYLTGVVTRDLGPQDGDLLADGLGELCGWAWKAAMGPLLTPYLGGGRVPRIVLVPMGDLARVPWQAARRPDGRYVVEQAALSQTASARMLCDSAAAEPVRITSGGLVLADPDTGGRAPGLPSARLEAYAIHQSFYPGAGYVGRRPDGTVSRSGAGTPDDVRSWLRADGAHAGTMLHLASHGTIETAGDGASSRLILAGGDLTADELIGIMAEADRHPVALVVLAACHTGRSIHGYDEAYSLGTMFLAAGARSVLSTQWSVPDQETSLLMYLFHHYLTTERRAPWDALRQAQMWMLDPDRQPPRHMPLPLRRMLDDTEPARVVAWAGFVHWGQ
ncbi:CHAT domain-containing protein [Actinoplanes siamensis]|uniref:CHAT domain-containing protein n=1 Tax=Actinoplanes siamensis TaxID=1223317 RepID=A0A919TL73_9ACTN|nr:CHAT domain-containing protein [Actinoplanes siamensis]GIF06846.1 hypothetical protein Asi03nite_43840 [Actinoplanes siamensis]